MQLRFLGTRGGIKARSELHWMHSSLLISHKDTTIIIDRGEDWLKKPFIPADALLITHAHSDHVGGLALGCPYPVCASMETWNTIKNYPIQERIALAPRLSFTIGSLSIDPFPVYHSLRAPAYGYRITDGIHNLFYISDLAAIKNEHDALTGLNLYIGDGAIINRSLLLRKKNNILTGHAPITEQLSWCYTYNIPQAIFTHCGTEIVTGDLEAITARISPIAEKYQIRTSIAYDTMFLSLANEMS